MDSAQLHRGAETNEGWSRRLLALMFTDIVDSTPLVARLGDERWLAILSRHDDLLESCVAAACGRVVNQIGDGFFVVFEDAANALRCALDIQETLAAERQALGCDLRVRIGVHWRPVLEVPGNYVGCGVHEAARLGKLARADEVLVSAAALEASDDVFLGSKPRFVELRGLGELIEVVALHPVPRAETECLARL